MKKKQKVYCVTFGTARLPHNAGDLSASCGSYVFGDLADAESFVNDKKDYIKSIHGAVITGDWANGFDAARYSAALREYEKWTCRIECLAVR